MKKVKVLIASALAFLLHVNKTHAQGLYAADMNGTPIRAKSYTNVNGSPYLTDKWQKGIVQLSNGQTYHDVDLKYDMVADNLMFKDKKGDSLTFVQPVKEFRLAYINDSNSETHLFRSGFPSTGAKTNTNSFYEVLYDGGTKLLKKEAKSIWMETTTYGTATQTQNITSHITYYVVKGDKITSVKPDRKSIESALGDKSAELDKYIKDNKLDVKKDEDLIKLFTYYNSI